MPKSVLNQDTPSRGIAGIQMRNDNRYSSDKNIEDNLGVGFNLHTPDFKRNFDEGLGTVWTTTDNQPDYFQNLLKYRVKQTKQIVDSQDTEMGQIDPETLSKARRLGLQSNSTSEDLAREPQRTDELEDMAPLDFPKKITPRIENIIPLPEFPRRDQQQVMYVSY